MDWSLLGFQGLGQLFNVHPVFVHFPIALFPTTLLFYFFAVILKKERFFTAGQACLLLGFISTLPAVITGSMAEETFEHGEVVHHMMETHQLIGYTILGLSAIAVIWSFVRREGKPRAPRLFLLLLLVTVLFTLQNADLGGRMVFVEGAAVKAIHPQSSEPADHDHGDHQP